MFKRHVLVLTLVHFCDSSVLHFIDVVAEAPQQGDTLGLAGAGEGRESPLRRSNRCPCVEFVAQTDLADPLFRGTAVGGEELLPVRSHELSVDVDLVDAAHAAPPHG
ncbi:MAG TPA: hypothetical protein VGM17_13605 [Rhizomicrobium sp.]|jgi:hypothetical protein